MTRSCSGRPKGCYQEAHDRHSASYLQLDLANTNGSWTYKSYTISYELPTNFILVESPAMIATTCTAATETAVILSELFGFLDRFKEIQQKKGGYCEHSLLDNGDRHAGDIFAISCSSMELATFICDQTPIIGSPYELVYDLNGRSLIPRARFEAIKARDGETKQADRDRMSNEHIALANRMRRSIDSREDQSQQARIHATERHEDKKTMALLLFAFKDDNKITRKLGTAENSVSTCNFKIVNWENMLRTSRNEYDDFIDGETPAAQRKAVRAKEDVERFEDLIAKENEKIETNSRTTT